MSHQKRINQKTQIPKHNSSWEKSIEWEKVTSLIEHYLDKGAQVYVECKNTKTTSNRDHSMGILAVEIEMPNPIATN